MSKVAAKQVEPPRYWKVAIRRLTGLNYCDRDCDCGENNELWWFPVTTSGREAMPAWVPGWMNGADTFSIWRWLVEKGHAQPAQKRKRRLT